MRKTLISVAALLMLMSACTDDDPSATTLAGSGPGGGISAVAANFDPSSISFAASLELFDSCDAVLQHFKSEALARVGPYGLNAGGHFFPDRLADEMAFEEAGGRGFSATTTAPASVAVGDGLTEGVDFSGSNVQVVGVDEPDIMKTDGSRILAFTNQTLHYVEVSGGTVSVLTNRAIPAEQIEVKVVEQQLTAARARKANSPELFEIRDRLVTQARAQLRVARR